MKPVTNIVAYAVDGATRKPLVSVAPTDESGVFKIQHAASACYRDAEQRGVPQPDIVIMEETRVADEAGKTNGTYRQMNAQLRAKEGDKGVNNLDEFFASRAKKKE